jgi:hypothetical protein
MKKIILTLTVLGLCFNLYSQKAKIEKVNVKQLHLPTNPFLSHIKTFASDFNSEFDKIPNYKENSLKIISYERVDVEIADIVVKLEIKNGSFSHKFDKKVSTKEKDGKKIEEKKEYIFVNASLDVKCTLLDNKGRVIHTVSYPNYNKITKGNYQTGEMEASMDAAVEWKRSSKELISRAVYDALSNVKKATQQYLNKHFSYYTEDITFKIATGKGKKVDYTDLDQALVKFQGAAQLYSDDPNSVDAKIKLEECINIWTAAVKEHIPNDKKARISDKNITKIYHNLSVAYYLLDKFDNALNWAEKESALNSKETITERINERKKSKIIDAKKEKKEKIYKILSDHLEFLRNNNYGKSIERSFYDQANHAYILELVYSYEFDENEKIRREAYRIVGKVGDKTNNQELKEKSVQMLLQACNDKEPGNISYGLRYFSGFSKKDFNQESIKQIGEFLKDEKLMRNYELINLAGLLRSEEYIPILKNITNSPNVNEKVKWRAIQALARIGDKSSIDKALTVYKSKEINHRFFMDVVPGMIFTGQKEIYDYLIEILISDEYLCSSNNPNSENKISCSYLLIPELAKVIVNFPIKVNRYGNLIYDGEEKNALQEVRDWFIANKNYKIK